MSKVVDIPGGRRASFPDDATDEQISAVLARDYPAPPPEPPVYLVPPVTTEDNLARAARDYAGLKSIGMEINTRQEPPNPLVTGLARALTVAGRAVYGEMMDIGSDIFGETMRERASERRGEGEAPPRNIEALISGEDMPAEKQIRNLPAPLNYAAEGVRGFVESTPKLAAVAGGHAFGVPAAVTAPVVFGSTEHGFDYEQAAVAAALPWVGRYSGEIVGKLAQTLGVDTTVALNIIKGLGGMGAAAGFLGLIDWRHIRNLPPDEQHQAKVEAVGGFFSQLAMGPVGVKFKARTPAEVAAAEMIDQVRASRSNPRDVEADVEAEAIAGGQGLATMGERAPGPAIVTAEDFLAIEPKPPVEPKEPISGVSGRTMRPTVPATPPEPYETVLQTIRAADARTIGAIQQLFPKAQLNRERARVLRDAAFPPVAGVTAPKEAPQALTAPEVGDEGPGAGGGARPAAAAPKVPDAMQFAIDEAERRLAAGDAQGAKGALNNTFDHFLTEKLKELEDRINAQLKPPAAGANFQASTPVSADPVGGHYDLVDAWALKTSDDKGYPPELQPRDRARTASAQQIAGIVSKFEPQRLGHSATTDQGAPMVDDAGHVLSGNGRTLALRALYQSDRGNVYKDWLTQNAEEFGLTPEQVQAEPRPVLVRRVTNFGKLNKVEFARLSNQQQVLGMSEAEKAASDAKMLLGAKGLVETFPAGRGRQCAGCDEPRVSQQVYPGHRRPGRAAEQGRLQRGRVI